MANEIILSEIEKKRFYSKIDKNGPLYKNPQTGEVSHCWEWKASSDGRGYGHLTLHRKSVKAHRVAWVISRGQIPDGMHVLHFCDNPPCCNESHLFLGTPVINAADRESKHRGNQPRGDSNGRHTKPERTSRGEHHSAVMRRVAARGDASGSRKHPESRPLKVTDAQCNQIRSLRNQVPPVPQSVVARMLGISRSMVSFIENGKRRTRPNR